MSSLSNLANALEVARATVRSQAEEIRRLETERDEIIQALALVLKVTGEAVRRSK